MKKHTFYTELAYILGLVLLAMGTALTAQTDFGVSMVVAPAYLLHLKVSETLPFFSFGMAEYCLQAVVLLLMILVLRKVKGYFFLSIAVAVVYGFLLDGAVALAVLLPFGTPVWDTVFYILGVLLCALGVSLLFRAYLPPEVYELFVKEIARKNNRDLSRCKTVYDLTSCAVAIVLSLLFFGNIQGVGVGTVVTALVNGSIIGLFSRMTEKCFAFEDGLPLRKYF